MPRDTAPSNLAFLGDEMSLKEQAGVPTGITECLCLWGTQVEHQSMSAEVSETNTYKPLQWFNSCVPTWSKAPVADVAV